MYLYVTWDVSSNMYLSDKGTVYSSQEDFKSLPTYFVCFTIKCFYC